MWSITKRWLLILILSFSMACEEGIEQPLYSNLSETEKLLVGDWSFDYILMGNDTITSINQLGEPRTSGGINHEVGWRYLRYTVDHAYELQWEKSIQPGWKLGTGVNYQPNFGFWDLSYNEDTLIHNNHRDYTRKYIIEELSPKLFRRKLVGDRTSLYHDGNNVIMDTLRTTWIEVFKPRQL